MARAQQAVNDLPTQLPLWGIAEFNFQRPLGPTSE